MIPPRVAALLAAALGGGPEPDAGGEARWRWRPVAAAPPVSVAFAWTSDWLSLSAPLTVPADPTPLARLRCQSQWPGLLRLDPERLPTVCGDVPVRLDDTAGRQWTVRQLRLLAHALHTLAGQPGAQPAPVASPDAVNVLAALPDALARRGWQVTLDSQGCVRVPLPLPGACQSLLVAPCAHGLNCELRILGHDFSAADPGCSQALALCLLRAGASLRWLQSFVATEGEAMVSAGFRCLVSAPAPLASLLLALDALVAAAHLFGEELEALSTHQRLARDYLDWVLPEAAPARYPPEHDAPRATPPFTTLVANAAVA